MMKKSGLAALQPSEESDFAATARDILDYVLRDMTHPDGGFYSAEDADSEGHEGKFYCWTHEELSKLLSPEEFNVAARYFGITKEGNFIDHSHPTAAARTKCVEHGQSDWERRRLAGPNFVKINGPARRRRSGRLHCSPPPKRKCSTRGAGASVRISTTKSSLPGTA